MVLEGGRAVAGGLGHGDPQLDALEGAAVVAGGLLGMRDAVACGHEVELARTDDLLGAETVAVQGLTVDEPGHRVQTDVRMRGDVEAARLVDVGGTHVVGEAPGADRTATARRECPANGEPSDLGLTTRGDLDRW